jgi:LmbE family N-acetylglucosaminyl deacetylase
MPGRPDFLNWLASGTGTADCRVLIVAAHPDDETIGIGSQLPRLSRVTVLHVTDGAPRDGKDMAAHGFADCGTYAAARRRELAEALGLAGLRPDAAYRFGVPDQEASLHLADLAHRLAAHMAETDAEIVVTHAYEGGHPDHDATAFAVHAALRLASLPDTRLLEMAGYHTGPAGMAVCTFLPGTGEAPVTITLSPEECALKQRMLACFATQRQVLAAFPVGRERLRPASCYDFTAPPHPGRLFYENFPWGMTGAHFRSLATAALDGLGLDGLT